jgi:hypothetical protein
MELRDIGEKRENTKFIIQVLSREIPPKDGINSYGGRKAVTV